MGNNTENLNVSLELGRRWLEQHEVPSMPGTRCFRMSVGGEPFVLRLDHRPEAAPHAGGLPEDPRAASNQEVLLAVARVFLGSLVEYPRPEPDLERGWEAYREQLLETHGVIFCPPWQELSGEHREAVACLVRAAVAGEVPSDQSSVISEQPVVSQMQPRVRRPGSRLLHAIDQSLFPTREPAAGAAEEPDTDEFRERMAENLADHGGPQFVSMSLKEWQAQEAERGGR